MWPAQLSTPRSPTASAVSIRRRYPSCFLHPRARYRIPGSAYPIGRRGPRRAAGRCGLRLVRGATDTRRDRFGGCRCSGRGRETATVSVGSSRSTRYMRAFDLETPPVTATAHATGHRRTRQPPREDVATGPPARTATATATPNRHAARPAPTPYEPRPAACPAVPSVAAVCRLPSSVAEMRSGWIAGCP